VFVVLTGIHILTRQITCKLQSVNTSVKKLDTTTTDRHIKLHNKKLYSILFILFYSSIYYYLDFFCNLSGLKRILLDSFDVQSTLIQQRENCKSRPTQRDMRGTQNLISHCINFKHFLLANIIIVASFVSILMNTYCLSIDSV